MLAGTVAAFQTHRAHYATAIVVPNTNVNEGVRILAPGGTVNLTNASPRNITYYDGAATTIVMPSRTSLDLNTTFFISNTGNNTSFNLTMKFPDGFTFATIAPYEAYAIKCVDNTAGNSTNSNCWEWYRYVN